MSKHRIVLLHATPVAMEPIRNAFLQRWPEAEMVNLLDDGLTIDRAKDAELTPSLIERFVDFGRYAHRIGADGILVTCSAFGTAIDRMAAELPVPVLKPNEAMFRTALKYGRNVGMLATFAPSVMTMTDEFDLFVKETGTTARVDTIVVDGAMDRLRAGDVEGHNNRIAARAAEFKDHDVIMLAHFSTSRAQAAVEQMVEVPVLSAPGAAVEQMRRMVTGAAGRDEVK
ncbi:aspartate/glutamate racemase family protein [Nitratireductor sp. ZSWI3]|uniref:aspartate/glutamate racemase family protein n=1 Tax=Nitratireductor sp. ZSWI3 TaxID=2966359 RepID=UPI0021503336|nr:aspartate/glutamate racemase family protein [Nitratireductor sp. ZSWI3]MCR4265196.1 aspartate/glutamate racemase family protein [Nitratireductor sp. ZSWI3]